MIRNINKLTVAYQFGKQLQQSSLDNRQLDAGQSIGSLSSNFGKAMEGFVATGFHNQPGIQANINNQQATRNAQINLGKLSQVITGQYNEQDVDNLVIVGRQAANEAVKLFLSKQLEKINKAQISVSKETNAPVDLQGLLNGKISFTMDIKSQYTKNGRFNRIRYGERSLTEITGHNYGAFLVRNNYWVPIKSEPTRVMSAEKWVEATRRDWFVEFLQKVYGAGDTFNISGFLTDLLYKSYQFDGANLENKYIVNLRFNVKAAEKDIGNSYQIAIGNMSKLARYKNVQLKQRGNTFSIVDTVQQNRTIISTSIIAFNGNHAGGKGDKTALQGESESKGAASQFTLGIYMYQHAMALASI